jgi:hypothetical protein
MSVQNLKNKFSKQEFPERLISREVPINHREYIFDGPGLNYNKDNSNFSKGDSFYIDEINIGNNYKRNYIQPSKNFYNKNEWKIKNTNTAYPQNTQNVFNNPYTDSIAKGKNIKEFIENLEMTLANNFTLENSYINLNNENKKRMNFESMIGNTNLENNHDSNEVKEEINKNNESNKTIFTHGIKEEIDSIPINSADHNNNYNFAKPMTNSKSVDSFTPVKIKLIYNINEKLKYPRSDPLWYVYHTVSKSSFGPISSLGLEEIYHQKHIDGQSEVRFIDIFKIRNKGAFAYFKLIEIENPNFLKEMVEPTNLLRYVEELNKIKDSTRVEIKPVSVNNGKTINKNEINQGSESNSRNKENINNDFTKEILNKYKNKSNYINYDNYEKIVTVVDVDKNNDIIKSTNTISNNNKNKNIPIHYEASTLVPPVKTIINTNYSNPAVKNKNKNKKQYIPISVPINTTSPSVIDEEFRNVKREEEDNKEKDKDAFKKKGKKKAKGKPVDLDIKTGFYTLSQQEKNYEPIYICGEAGEK